MTLYRVKYTVSSNNINSEVVIPVQARNEDSAIEQIEYYVEHILHISQIDKVKYEIIP